MRFWALRIWARSPAAPPFFAVQVPLLRQSAEALLQRVPRRAEGAIANALADIAALPGVEGVDRVHIWAHTPDELVASLRLALLPGADAQAALRAARLALAEAGAAQVCVQVEEVAGGSGAGLGGCSAAGEGAAAGTMEEAGGTSQRLFHVGSLRT